MVDLNLETVSTAFNFNTALKIRFFHLGCNDFLLEPLNNKKGLREQGFL